MSDSVQPHRQQPTRLPHPWDSPGKNTGVGCHFLLQCMKGKSESEVAQSCPTLATPWTAAHQAPPSMGFSRQEYWSGVPSPSPDTRVWGRPLLQEWEFYRLMSGRSISAILGKGRGFPGAGPLPTFGSLVSLRAITAPMGMSLSLLMCSSECVLRLTVCWKSTPLPSWT